MRNRHAKKAAAALALCATLVVGTASLASAGSPGFSIDPVSGPAGTVITATGGGCADGAVSLALYSGEHMGFGVQNAEPIATSGPFPTEPNNTDNNTWQGTIKVPNATPAGPITVVAQCSIAPNARRADARAQSNFFFQNQPFTVTAAVTTTTTAPSTTTTVPGSTTTTAPGAAAPATATPAQPTFTG